MGKKKERQKTALSNYFIISLKATFHWIEKM